MEFEKLKKHGISICMTTTYSTSTGITLRLQPAESSYEAIYSTSDNLDSDDATSKALLHVDATASEYARPIICHICHVEFVRCSRESGASLSKIKRSQPLIDVTNQPTIHLPTGKSQTGWSHAAELFGEHRATLLFIGFLFLDVMLGNIKIEA